MEQIKTKSVLNLIMLFSFFAIASAYFIEHVLGHKPCNLCFIERIPYLLSIIIIILTLVLKKFEKTVLALLSMIFMFGTIVSFYHFGIEQGFFNESLVCSLEKNNLNYSIIEYIKNGISQEEIRNICNILNTRPIGIVRTSDTNYKELNITPAEELDDSYMTNMIIQNPNQWIWTHDRWK